MKDSKRDDILHKRHKGIIEDLHNFEVVSKGAVIVITPKGTMPSVKRITIRPVVTTKGISHKTVVYRDFSIDSLSKRFDDAKLETYNLLTN